MKVLIKVVMILTVLSPTLAHAESHEGKIVKFHLNPDYTDRGACIQMDPAITNPSKWACTFNVNGHLDKEMTSLLLAASASGTTCSIVWTELNSNGHAKIRSITCDY